MPENPLLEYVRNRRYQVQGQIEFQEDYVEQQKRQLAAFRSERTMLEVLEEMIEKETSGLAKGCTCGCGNVEDQPVCCDG